MKGLFEHLNNENMTIQKELKKIESEKENQEHYRDMILLNESIYSQYQAVINESKERQQKSKDYILIHLKEIEKTILIIKAQLQTSEEDKKLWKN